MNFLNQAVAAIKPREDDTLVDRANYYYTAMIIIVLAVTLTAKQYVGQPIQCWVPAEFTKPWEQYAENYCFVYNTFFVKPDEEIPAQVDERVKRQLIYYQWVPFLMALEAGFFYVPMVFWISTSGKSGINITKMVKLAQGAEDAKDKEERIKTLDLVAQHIDDSVRLQGTRREGASHADRWCKMGLLNGTYVANMYIVTKLLFILNLVVQFLMMNQFLGQNDPGWGIKLARDIMNGENWAETGNFPRISICDFTVRSMGNVHRFSIQCVLVLNMFNEKIFLFLYWWFLIICLFTIIELFIWIYNTRSAARRMSYIRRYAKALPEEMALFHEFCNRKLNADGVLLLRMINYHATEIFTQELVHRMWNKFRSSATLNHVVTHGRSRKIMMRKSSASSISSSDAATLIAVTKAVIA
uniref:Innexin n=1 Tax=Acrobeloides nanus TaxID=290746 RepID=A0A914BW62_9BILA